MCVVRVYIHQTIVLLTVFRILFSEHVLGSTEIISKPKNVTEEAVESKIGLPKYEPGNFSYIDEFPFIASLRDGSKHYCTAVIVTVNWVLTAAHCCIRRPANRCFVIAGETDAMVDVSSEIQRCNVVRFVPNELFNTMTKNHDIAFVKLGTDLRFGVNVQPCKFPGKYPDHLSEVLIDGDVVGYNEVKPTNKTDPMNPVRNMLQNMSFGVLSEEETVKQCKNRNHYQICLNRLPATVKTCWVDDGAVLVSPYGDHIVYGVFAYKINCDLVMFTRVDKYLDFVEKVSEKEDGCGRVNDCLSIKPAPCCIVYLLLLQLMLRLYITNFFGDSIGNEARFS